MAKGPTYVVHYRRKRKKKTDYKKRLGLLKSGLPRLVVRKSNKHVIVQLVKYESEGDKVTASAHSKDLKKFGWKYSTSNLPAAYLTGLLCGKRALNKTKDAILDLGKQSLTKGSGIYAALKGAIDAGMNIPADESVFPPEARVSGEHIAAHKKIPDIVSDFNKVKASILESK